MKAKGIDFGSGVQHKKYDSEEVSRSMEVETETFGRSTRNVCNNESVVV